jgi:chromosomal replication initiation ATPase DnaA
VSNPSVKIKYIEAKDFGKMVHDAIVGNSASVDLEEIKREYLDYDILLVDDIQMIRD